MPCWGLGREREVHWKEGKLGDEKEVMEGRKVLTITAF